MFSATAINIALSCCTVTNENVLVNTNAEVDENICAPWDKTTSIEAYKTVYIRSESASEPDYLLGDVNNDGTIDSTDYMRIKSHFLGTLTLEDKAFKAGDVDASTEIDSTDYLRVKGHFLGSYNLRG